MNPGMFYSCCSFISLLFIAALISKCHILTQKSLDMSTRRVGFVNALYSTLRHH